MTTRTGKTRTTFAIALGVAVASTVAMTRTTSSQDNGEGVAALATWNAIALRTTSLGKFSPPQETRSMAMQSIAVFDAVNSITRAYELSGAPIAAERSASIRAAIAAASYRVLSALYPAAAAALQASYDSSLAALAAGRERDAGTAVGQAAANVVIAMRSNDGASQQVSYATRRGVGAWVTTPPSFTAALEPGWGKVTPFALDSGSQVRPPAPPPPGSEAYVRDYREVATSGAAVSSVRTRDQADAARFWLSTAAQLWNQPVRQLTVDRRMEVTAAARAYLLLNVAGADAMIAAWDAKYAYGQWRPVTAIRYRDDNSLPSTQTDTGWTPLLVTPPFPDYPAGHTAYGGAAEHVLIATFGDKPGTFAITSAAAEGMTRRYASFSELCEEVVNARVWAGVHWRTSSTAGRDLGMAVGALAMSRAPKVTKP